MIEAVTAAEPKPSSLNQQRNLSLTIYMNKTNISEEIRFANFILRLTGFSLHDDLKRKYEETTSPTLLPPTVCVQ